MNHLRKRLKRFLHNSKSNQGQGIAEYVIVLGVAGVMIILLANVLQPQIEATFSRFVERAPVAPPNVLNFTPPPTGTVDPNAPTNTPTNTPENTPTHTSTPEVIVDIQINFQPSGRPVPENYIPDYGNPYAYDSINDQTYGWDQDMTGRTRDRFLGATTYSTLNHFYHNDTASFGTWNIALPDGNYNIFIVAGDEEFYDLPTKIDVEGITLIDGTTTEASRRIEASGVIRVTDGRLTVSALDDLTTTKINFIHISTSSGVPINTPTPTPSPSPTPSETPIPAGLVRINFEPNSYSNSPDGFLIDIGEVYDDRGNGYSYGWNTNVIGRTRERDAYDSPNAAYSTLIHMFTSSNYHTWEIERPNACYDVTVVGGDAQYTNHPRLYQIYVEGIEVVNGSTAATANGRWLSGSIQVNTTDGRITITTGAGSATKLNFVEINDC